MPSITQVPTSAVGAPTRGSARWRSFLSRAQQALALPTSNGYRTFDLSELAAGSGDSAKVKTTRTEVARHRGREVDTAGDGLLAVFDGPARTVRCAFAIRDAVRSLALEVRAGAHTGEVEVSDQKVTGIAVHIGRLTWSPAASNPQSSWSMVLTKPDSCFSKSTAHLWR